MNSEEIVMKYWTSWQSHSDWSTMRSLMTDDFKFDAGFFKTESAEQIIDIMKKGHPWKDIVMLAQNIQKDKAFLIYEGMDSVTSKKYRVAEYLILRDKKVAECLTTISEYPDPKEQSN